MFSNSTIKVWTVGDTQWRLDASAEICITRCGTRSQIQAKRQTFQKTVSPRIVLNSMEAEHQILGKGGFLLHAAYIRHGDGAILFTAPSGTGKSTQADLLCRTRDAELINGDRAAVCCRENGVWAMRFCRNMTFPRKSRGQTSQSFWKSSKPWAFCNSPGHFPSGLRKESKQHNDESCRSMRSGTIFTVGAPF